MNEDEGYTIYCSKCGAEMNSRSRYCMKCGNLNYDHEANKNMVPFKPKRRKKYQVGSGQSFSIHENGSRNLRISVSERIGKGSICFFFNIGIFLILMVLSFLTSTSFSFDLDVIMASSFPKFAIVISLVFLYQYALELLFMKCNRPWWEALIPIYNYLVLGEVVFRNKWIGALALIPGVNVFFLCYLFYRLGKSFHVSPILCALFFVIYIPILGFGSPVYNGALFVSNDSPKAVESEYQYRKIGLFFIIIFLLLGFALLFMNSMSANDQKDMVDGYYFSYASRKIVSKVEKAIDNGDVNCKYDKYSSSQGVYYFQFGSLGEDVFLLLYDMREPIQGYVKVDNTSGEHKVYVSLTDGTFGFRETLAEEIDVSTLKNYKSTEYVTREMNTCKIVR